MKKYALNLEITDEDLPNGILARVLSPQLRAEAKTSKNNLIEVEYELHLQGFSAKKAGHRDHRYSLTDYRCNDKDENYAPVPLDLAHVLHDGAIDFVKTAIKSYQALLKDLESLK